MSSQSKALVRAARHLAITLSALGTLSACSLFQSREGDASRTLPGEAAATQSVDPNITRPEVQVKRIKAQDYELGGYAQGIVLDRNHTVGLYGVRAAYHKTDKFFVEGNVAFSSKIGFEDVRQAIGASEDPGLDYSTYEFSVGYDLVPGDLYITQSYTLPFSFYAIGGLGYVDYEGVGNFAYSYGGGLRVTPTDYFAIRFELRNQAWSDKKTNDNAAFSIGVSGYF
ncbi:outer membrane beta-barrel domain-containing protein [Hydrocarboniphaga sp.]|uniref:outer membrane beta-barrel domain-containing protein n=1 Tax=Hydrocarboniphaga sp. TaxID=2033016 RepID=UPI003D0C2762